jgi:hypothetical protein
MNLKFIYINVKGVLTVMSREKGRESIYSEIRCNKHIIARDMKKKKHTYTSLWTFTIF